MASSIARPLLLVRKPSPLLSKGQLTHLSRSTSSPPTHATRLKQWQAYVSIYAQHGWEVIEAPEADECPDGVFLEDAIIVFPNLSLSVGGGTGGVVVLPRSGSVERRKEYPSAKKVVEEHLVPRGFEVFDFEKEDVSGRATCDGGDILKIYESKTVYIGRSTRTNEEGFTLLKKLLEPRGWSVVGVPVNHHLHLSECEREALSSETEHPIECNAIRPPPLSQNLQSQLYRPAKSSETSSLVPPPPTKQHQTQAYKSQGRRSSQFKRNKASQS